MRIPTLLSALTLATLSHAAVAGWAQIDSPPDRTVYIDLTSAKKVDTIVRIWVLIDHHTVQQEAGDFYLSSKGQWEVDCRSSFARQTFHVIYPAHMGSGETLWSGALNRQFQPIVPGSLGQSIFEAACGKQP